VLGKLMISERRVCRVLGQHRSTQRRQPRGRADEERLVADMVDPTVSISTILSRQFDHVRHKAFFICAAPWLTSLCRAMLTKYTANSALGNHQLAKHLIDASTTTCGA
jgi:hypothetical protein